ncbi:MAG: hypothetical protein ABIJ56_19175 [Pseudomonadota bacterium]
MTEAVSQAVKGFKEDIYEFKYDINPGEEKIGKGKDEPGGNVCVIGKKPADGWPGSCGKTAPPVFMADMLLNKASADHFEVTQQDIMGGGGKKAGWVRSALLEHIREKGAGGKFLRSLASTSREGVELVWRKVLDGLGLKGHEQKAMIGGLVDETAWVATALVRDSVKESVLKVVDNARQVAGEIAGSGEHLENFAKSLVSTKDDARRALKLQAAGFGKDEARRISLLLADGSPEAGKKAAGRLASGLSGLIEGLDKVRAKVAMMPLGKYDALLDFKPELRGVLKNVGAGLGQPDFLSIEVLEAECNAYIGSVASTCGKLIISVASLAAFSFATAGIIGPGTSTALKVLWHAAAALETGADNAPGILDMLQDKKDKALLENIGLKHD